MATFAGQHPKKPLGRGNRVLAVGANSFAIKKKDKMQTLKN
jgi:hypothetical protein